MKGDGRGLQGEEVWAHEVMRVRKGEMVRAVSSPLADGKVSFL